MDVVAAKIDLTWISEAIAQASRTENFSASGTLQTADIGLAVARVGEVPLPLKPKVAKQLISVAKVAPFGKGTKTLVNTKVRNSFEVDAKLVDFSDSWNEAIQETTRSVAEQLGLPADQLQAKPYKLLLYERGGHFLPHRDSEKVGRMVGSLVVVLPTQFSGGELFVRHGTERHRFEFDEAASGNAANYVAFYADCEHEVKRVTRGRRLAMTYNLYLKKPRRANSAAPGESDSEANPAVDALVNSLKTWYARRPGDPVIFALDHQYTQKGLRMELLKGADRSLAELIAAATGRAESRLYLVQFERHLLQYADDGSYGRRSWGYRSVDVDDLEIGEAYEDDLNATFRVNAMGKRQRFGSLPLDPTAIISAIPIEEWKPTSEEYEGYTGNAGNTLDRWYHRSAIIVWDDAHHFDVLARAGTETSVSLLDSMLKKLSKTPKKRLDAAQEDCTRLTRAIIRKWPTRYEDHFHGNEPWLRSFVSALVDANDLGLTREFLSTVARRDKSTAIDKLVLSVCRAHGVASVFDELEQLLRVESNQYRPAIALRDFQWLKRICCDRKLAGDGKLLKKLCGIAADRFCKSFIHDKSAIRYRRVETTISSKAMRSENAICRRLLWSGWQRSVRNWNLLQRLNLCRQAIGRVQPMLNVAVAIALS